MTWKTRILAVCAAALLSAPALPALAVSYPTHHPIACARIVGHGKHRHSVSGHLVQTPHGVICQIG